MVILTRRQLQKMNEELLINEFLNFNDILSQFAKITSHLDYFQVKYEKTHSELVATRNCNDILKSRIISLEKYALDLSQYLRGEMVEKSLVPTNIGANTLEQTVCDALSVTGITVAPVDLEACHRLTKKELLSRQKVFSSIKNLSR